METPAPDELGRLLDAFDTALDMDEAQRAEWVASVAVSEPALRRALARAAGGA
jgi:hypothetical protein